MVILTSSVAQTDREVRIIRCIFRQEPQLYSSDIFSVYLFIL